MPETLDNEPSVVETRNLSVMFTDIKGFTEKTSSVSRSDLDNLLGRYESIVEPAIADHAGKIIKRTGDGFLVTFESPTNAVLAGVRIQVELRAHNDETTEPIHVRIGINAGEVNLRKGDVYGDAVNIASRIESEAEPGEVFFSESVFLTMNKTEIHERLGEAGLNISEVGFKSLKGVPDPVRIFRAGPRTRAPGMLTMEIDGPFAEADMQLAEQPTPMDLDAISSAPSIPLALQPTPPAGVKAVGRRSSGATGRATVGKRDKGARWFQRFLLLGPFCAVVVLFLIAIALQASAFAILCALGVVMTQPLVLGQGNMMMVIRVAALLAVIGILIGAPGTVVRGLQERSDVLAERAVGGKLHVVDRVGAFALHGAYAGLLAYKGEKEAAVARMLMMRPGGEWHRWASELPMSAPAVQVALGKVVEGLRAKDKKGTTPLPANKVSLTSRAPRGLLALTDSVVLEGEAVRAGDAWVLELQASTNLRCDKAHRIAMGTVAGVSITHDESLCWALSQKQWLRRFLVQWKWEVSSKDPRIVASALGE